MIRVNIGIAYSIVPAICIILAAAIAQGMSSRYQRVSISLQYLPELRMEGPLQYGCYLLTQRGRASAMHPNNINHHIPEFAGGSSWW